MNRPFTIKTPESEDFDQMLVVWEESVRATHLFLTEEDILFFKPLVKAAFFQDFNLKIIRDTEEKVIGFIGVENQKIEMLFIDPKWRGKGMGSLLLDYAIQEMNARQLDVNEQNEQAVGFYQKKGFIPIGRSPLDGLGKPFPLLHMEWKGES